MNVTTIYQLKAIDSEIKQNSLNSVNFSNDFTLDQMKKKTRLNRSNPIDTKDALDIHRFLMKEK